MGFNTKSASKQAFMTTLRKLDTRQIPVAPDEIRLFSFVRNEAERMPYFLQYYRDLGVSRFFIIDDSSTDGTETYLLNQADCHVFRNTTSYIASNSGIHWRAELLDQYGVNHWCLSVDADELFVYPHSETVDIRKLCSFLEKEGSETIFTFLLDMYPTGPLKEAVCVPGKPFTEICSYFDRDYTFVDRIHLKRELPFPAQEAIGGPRTRCFYGYQGQNIYAWRLAMHVIERSIEALRAKGLNVPRVRLKSTPLFKVPLVKWKKGYAYTSSTHQLNRVPISKVSGALLHFKFFSDFHDRAVKAVEEGQYGQGSAEYKQYVKRMDGIGNLIYDGSTKYHSSHDLLQHKLITTTPAYNEFVHENRPD